MERRKCRERMRNNEKDTRLNFKKCIKSNKREANN